MQKRLTSDLAVLIFAILLLAVVISAILVLHQLTGAAPEAGQSSFIGQWGAVTVRGAGTPI